MDDDFVADVPAPHLRSYGPDDAGCVGAGDVKRILVYVERRDRLAEAGPDAVVVDAASHDVDEHLVFAIGHVGSTSHCIACSGGP